MAGWFSSDIKLLKHMQKPVEQVRGFYLDVPTDTAKQWRVLNDPVASSFSFDRFHEFVPPREYLQHKQTLSSERVSSIQQYVRDNFYASIESERSLEEGENIAHLPP